MMGGTGSGDDAETASTAATTATVALKGKAEDIAAEIALTDSSTPPPPHDDDDDPSSPHASRCQRQPHGAHISEELAEALLATADDDAASSPPPPVYEEEESAPATPTNEREELTEGYLNSTSPRTPDGAADAAAPDAAPDAAPLASPPASMAEKNGDTDASPDRQHEATATESDQSSRPNPSADDDPKTTGDGNALRQRQPSGLSPTSSPPHDKVQTSPQRSASPAPQPHQRQQQYPAKGAFDALDNLNGNFNSNLQSAHLRSPSIINYASPKSQSPPLQRHPGRRSITLHLLEEVPTPTISSPLLSSVGTPFRSLSKLRSLSLSASAFSSLNYGRARSGSDSGLTPLDERTPSATDARSRVRRGEHPDGAAGRGTSTFVDQGAITVSWYEGTTSAEMHEHVFNCVLRKLNENGKRDGKVRLEEVRLLDENVTPHGEVVLCPFLPDGSHFVLKFKTSIDIPPAPPKINHRPPYASRAPDSPSAEPSPFPSSPALDTMLARNDLMHQKQQQKQNEQQTQLLKTVAALLAQQQRGGNGLPPIPLIDPAESIPKDLPVTDVGDASDTASIGTIGSSSGAAKAMPNGGLMPKMVPIAEDPTTDQLIEQHLSQLNCLFAQRKSVSGVSGIAPPSIEAGPKATNMAEGVTMNGTVGGNTKGEVDEKQQNSLAKAYYREEKKQVIFVISNYLVLFMGFIALSAEIQSRLPEWMQWVQENYDSVQNCSTDRDALIECLSNGDFSGLVASFLLWATQSAAAKRIFLFGFDTPKKLWTVVYEAGVTAVCWGTSYIFIRRGLNPNTRENFLHKYWKDAVYGSLAGFNAAFMKAVLKNLVPQDVALEALEGGRQLKIFHWLGALMYDAE